MPKMLALRAVQRQAAASRSARPWMRVQQGVTGGCPTVMLTKPLSTLAQTPNFKASVGHLAFDERLRLGFGLGLGLGLGIGPLPYEVTSAKKTILRTMKITRDEEVFEPILIRT